MLLENINTAAQNQYQTSRLLLMPGCALRKTLNPAKNTLLRITSAKACSIGSQHHAK